MTDALLIGPEAIRDALKTLPLAPGVYRMLNAKGDILYVGKAKHLKNRVASYVSSSGQATKTILMVAQVARVEWTVTKNPAEALLLEANLVKKHRPRYNILLKDDKSFPYLLFSAHAYPRIHKHRGAREKGAEVFGPFASVGALNYTLTLLQRVFLLRPCADTIFKNRSRPCLQYQIKRCSAPCVKYVSEEQYASQLSLARDFLQGKSRAVQEALAAEMKRASDDMDYEHAAHLRDRIKALTQVQQEQGLRAAGLEDADLFALHHVGGRSTVAVYFFRQGMHYGSQSFHPTHSEDADHAAVMEAFLGQFYASHIPPKELLVSHEPSECVLLAEALSLNVPYKVQIRTPQRGAKSELMTQAMTQATAAHERAIIEAASVAQHLDALRDLLTLPRPPQRIEIFDNSHIMGTHQLGAMVVACEGVFKKSAYRTFNRKSDDTIAGDDLGMMREMMRRRFRGIAKNPSPSRGEDGGEGVSDLPELLLIDGGPTQLGVVREVLAELGLSEICTVAVSKSPDRNAGREWFHREGLAPFQLPVGDPLLHYLQRLRDEAHRFAIGAHRKRRSAAISKSALDDIPGIGPARKKALLHHFGSRSGVESATLAELRKVEGLNAKTAEIVYGYFHSA